MSSESILTGLVLPETVEEISRTEEGRRAEFLMQPLERGFGHTIGNTIRRILLSSLPGAAVWGFRADGVQHEHQTIEGVAEDVHQVIQNLKSLVLRLSPDVEEEQLELSVSEAGSVSAGSITESGTVEVVDPDHHLFTLQEDLPENRPLRVDLWVKRGRGFVMADEHDVPEGMPVDLIRVDSIFNPVIKANFDVRETRVGQRTDFDRLKIVVETSGALDPADALGHAAHIAREHVRYLAAFGEPVAQPRDEEEATGPEAPPGMEGMRPVDEELQGLLQQTLDAFDEISVRSRNTLEKENILTLGDVAGRTRDEMLSVPNFGEKSLEEVAEVLASHQLRFGMSLEKGEDGNLYVMEEAAAGNGAGGESEEADET